MQIPGVDKLIGGMSHLWTFDTHGRLITPKATPKAENERKEKTKSLKKNEKGMTALVSIIVLLASLMIGAIVFSQLAYQAQQVAIQNNDTAAQNFISQTTTTGWAAMNLFVIAAIVMAAGFILALLVAWGRGGSEV